MPLSFSLKGSKPSNATAASKAPTRPSAKPTSRLSQSLTAADDGPEPEAAPQQQQITTFGEGAEQEIQVKEQRIIRGIENDADGVMGVSRKRRRNEAEPKPENGNPTVKEEELNGEKKLAFGLTVVEKPIKKEPTEHSNGIKVEAKEEDLDSRALRALKGEDVGGQNESRITPPTEDEVFSRHFSDAPAPGSVQDYNATPVDGFGAAILRGYMKTGERLEDRIAAHKRGENIKDPKNRPSLLGLGAKEAEGVSGVEMGAWGAKRGKDAIGYNPLVRKNENTGEILTESELKDKLDRQKKEGGDKERDWKQRKQIDNLASRSRRDDEYESDRRDRRRERGDRREEPISSSRRDRSRDHDDYKSSSRRHRSRSADDRDRRRRDYHDNDEYRSRRHRDHREHRDRSRERNRN